VLSSDGRRVFFESSDALVPQDSNGTTDVYEWESNGTRTCTRVEGCISLISAGTSSVPSYFIDASESGSDVFFITASSLVTGDPGLVDLYDARENGGFPAPPPPPAPCEGDACQSPASAPSDPTPASTGFSGPGSPSAGFKKQQHKKRRPSRSHKQPHHKRSAHHKGGGAR
jgi:hypothetical protein